MRRYVRAGNSRSPSVRQSTLSPAVGSTKPNKLSPKPIPTLKKLVLARREAEIEVAKAAVTKAGTRSVCADFAYHDERGWTKNLCRKRNTKDAAALEAPPRNDLSLPKSVARAPARQPPQDIEATKAPSHNCKPKQSRALQKHAACSRFTSPSAGIVPRFRQRNSRI